MNKKAHHAWWIMISCGTISFCVLGVVMACSGIFFKPVCDYLGVSRGAFSLYMTIIYLAMFIVLPIAGKKMPTANFKKFLIAAMAVFTLTFAAMSQFTSLYHWYAAGVLMGISGAFVMFLPIPILINNWFKQKVGFALGLALAMSGVGGTLFNPVGAYIIQNYGWRTGYLALGLIAFAITMPFMIFVVRFKPAEMGLEPYGAAEAAATAQVQPQAGAKPAELPGVTAGQALKSPAFYTALIFAGMMTMSGTVQTHIPGYVTSIGLSAIVGGFAISMTSFGIIFGKLVMGYLNDKIGLSKAITTGTVLSAAGLITILAAGSNTTLLYVGAFIFGFGGISMGTVMPPMVVRQFFGQKDFSSIFSNIQSITTLLMAFAMTLYGFIFDLSKSYANSLLASLLFLLIAYGGYLLTTVTAKKLPK
ncbi:Sugar phosphate permease [Desulfitobacterium sp. LBE]|uniref:Transporter, major facilitator protein n=1 Tax=Desulfitobacterium hafniense TaxID=49338 RepID=A0A098B5E9_DESHA|nr:MULTISPECIES: MFS transporter [Desulfitobacterium]TWH57095.1 Sugar phosphate permease [Desulfitobacterium sp. LBE]CDX03577.1 Transporter, major facilitator protein [Desulfitobacterium hafniense]